MVDMLAGSVNSTLVIGSNKLPVEDLPTPTSPSHMVHSSSLSPHTPMKKAVETSL